MPAEAATPSAPAGSIAPSSATEATPQTTDQPSAGEQTSGTPSKTYGNPYEGLEDADPRELAKHPKVAGLVGDLAQRQTKRETERLREQIRTEERERIELERIEALKDVDPYQGVEEEKKYRATQRERKDAAEQETARSAGQQKLTEDLFLTYADNVLGKFATELPKEVRQTLVDAGKKYEGNWGDGFHEWLTDVVNARVDFERGNWEKDSHSAIEKDVLGRVNGRAPSPGLGGGTAPGGALTQQEWSGHRSDPAWRRANKERIDTALARGELR
jgi:hypothetical protein